MYSATALGQPVSTGAIQSDVVADQAASLTSWAQYWPQRLLNRLSRNASM
jgi:hypothetical protein